MFDIEKKDDNTVRLIGKIDTNTSIDFESRFRELVTSKKADIDCERLEYISSTGLRVLMKLLKDDYDLVLFNVSKDIKDVFEVTGLLDVLKLKTKPEEEDISLDDCKMIGRGMTASIYKINDEQIIKVYNEGIPLELVEEESQAARTAVINGVSTALPFQIVKTNGRYGAIYEYMNGTTLGSSFKNNPDKFDELVKMYVQLIKTMGRIEIVNGEFQTIKEKLFAALDRSREYFSKDDFELMNELIESMVDEKYFIHGDPHPGNIMVTEDGLKLIDMAEISCGPHYYEMAQIYSDLGNSTDNPTIKDIIEESFDMPVELIKKLWKAFVKEYYKGEDEDSIEKYIEELRLVSSVTSIARSGALPKDKLPSYMAKLKVERIDKIIRPNEEKIRRILKEGLSYKPSKEDKN